MAGGTQGMTWLELMSKKQRNHERLPGPERAPHTSPALSLQNSFFFPVSSTPPVVSYSSSTNLNGYPHLQARCVCGRIIMKCGL